MSDYLFPELAPPEPVLAFEYHSPASDLTLTRDGKLRAFLPSTSFLVTIFEYGENPSILEVLKGARDRIGQCLHLHDAADARPIIASIDHAMEAIR